MTDTGKIIIARINVLLKRIKDEEQLEFIMKVVEYILNEEKKRLGIF